MHDVAAYYTASAALTGFSFDLDMQRSLGVSLSFGVTAAAAM